MSAAAQILQHAIEDAVLQLEPQLLPLFGGGGRNARAHVERPTQRTHSALKMLVALTRFFPPEHSVRQAGRQLELIWLPLVHEPDGTAAHKLLQHYFRLRQDLLDPPLPALRRAMRGLVSGAIDAAQGGADAAQMESCERRLRQLAMFLPEWNDGSARHEGTGHAHDAGTAGSRLHEGHARKAWGESQASLSPLARLCAWQQALDGAAAAYDAPAGQMHPLLMPDVLAVLDRCTMLCRASNWTLEYFCNSGLARGLWQLRGLARFCGNEVLAQRCDALDDECLDMHLGGKRPPPVVLQKWLANLFCVVQAGPVALLPPPDAAATPELPFRAVYDHELANYGCQLQAELQTQTQTQRTPQGTQHGDCRGDSECSAEHSSDSCDDVSPNLKVGLASITVLYKLTWVFAAAGQHDWSRLCHCAYRVALQHWRIRRPVSAAMQRVLAELAKSPGSPQPAATLRMWRWQLLQDWPRWADDTQRPIALRHDAGEVVALEAVPDLLSGSFTTLVHAGRLAQSPSAQTCEPYYQVLVQDLATDLLQELALLEKGAAAMKVWPLEQLCTLLIAVYETHLRDEGELPAALLQHAHRQLVRMLDQAAAWREVELAAPLVQELEAWLRESAATRALCREPEASAAAPDSSGGDARQMLRAHLLACLGTLAPVLERPVRLQLDAGELQLDAARVMQVLDCLRPLIKFMLLDQSVDTRMRHAMHKPRVSTVAVTLRATSATLVVTVGEDSHEDLLAPSELQRLQRRLPKAAGALVCESRAGHGRSFTFTLGGQAPRDPR